MGGSVNGWMGSVALKLGFCGKQGDWRLLLLQRLNLRRWLVVGLSLVFWAGAISLFPLPAQAAADSSSASSALTPLTLELLKERIQNPSQSDGTRTIDLRRTLIDLRPGQSDIANSFYKLLQGQLQGQGFAYGLDLSYAKIKGTLDLRELGLRAPLYGKALDPIFSDQEKEQLNRDRKRLNQISQLSRSLLIQSQPITSQITVFRGPLKLLQTQFQGGLQASDMFFLNRIEAQGAVFCGDVTWNEARFSGAVNFTGTVFCQTARFRNTIFFSAARFSQTQFQGYATFQGSEFQKTANFNRADFSETADFSRISWSENADFAKTTWHELANLNRNHFSQSLFLTEARFDAPLSLRESRFEQPANLRSVQIFKQADFGDTSFAQGAYLNIANLKFNPEETEILGNPGKVSRRLSVPTLQGNETLLRNLVRNFRNLEQIADANQIEYMTETLRRQSLEQRLLGINVNRASVERLMQAGFSDEQAAAIVQQREEQQFTSTSDLLKLDEVDLATYVKMRDRIVAGRPLTPISWIATALHWVELSLLILLSRYGTSFGLTFGVGMVSLACFGLLFWLVDRVREHRFAEGITLPEAAWVLTSFGGLVIGGISAIVRSSDYPWLALLSLSLLIIPVPASLIVGRYRQPSEEPDRSYFVEDSSLRQLRILIGRLPIMPRYTPFFRERYQPILWERRWGWLNYFDLSLNNLLKFGFNDIRLRDEQMPGLITALVWYQWALGLLYFALLLWTLSRTIPGLNLLIYFK